MAATVKRASDLVGRREGLHLEFQREIDARGDFLASIVALLNTEGGTVYFGVEDTDEVATVAPGLQDPTREASRLIDMVADRIEPRPLLQPARLLETGGGRAVLELVVPRSDHRPHALRESSAFVVYERVADRNRPLPFSEIARIGGESARSADDMGELRDEMARARSGFLAEGSATTLRVACWPAPQVDARIDIDAQAVREVLADGSPIGVRSSGWNYLSTWSALQRKPRAIEVGRRAPTAYRRLRIEESGRIELTTDRDELWCWHVRGTDALVIDPFILTEYPASVLRLAAHLLGRASPAPSRVLVELVIRNAQGSMLWRGRPGAVAFGFGPGAVLPSTARDLCVGPTGPLDVDASELLANPDRIAHRLAVEAYHAFGLERSDVPFFDEKSQRFVFPK